jgi:ABC-type nitrate/sulfonate/bicarbonate transport system substrate-binding protein
MRMPPTPRWVARQHSRRRAVVALLVPVRGRRRVGIVVKEKAFIKTPSDLKCKTVAVNRGGIGECLLALALEKTNRLRLRRHRIVFLEIAARAVGTDRMTWAV